EIPDPRVSLTRSRVLPQRISVSSSTPFLLSPFYRGDAEQCRWRLALGAESAATERRGERWRTAEETSGPQGKKEKKRTRRKKEQQRGGEEEEEEDEQEGPLGIVRSRSLVTRDSCDPDDP
ncbi:hypothetical protein ALC60_12961, partial [Trachymyrmex zeteki]